MDESWGFVFSGSISDLVLVLEWGNGWFRGLDSRDGSRWLRLVCPQRSLNIGYPLDLSKIFTINLTWVRYLQGHCKMYTRLSCFYICKMSTMQGFTSFSCGMLDSGCEPLYCGWICEPSHWGFEQRVLRGVIVCCVGWKSSFCLINLAGHCSSIISAIEHWMQ